MVAEGQSTEGEPSSILNCIRQLLASLSAGGLLAPLPPTFDSRVIWSLLSAMLSALCTALLANAFMHDEAWEKAFLEYVRDVRVIFEHMDRHGVTHDHLAKIEAVLRKGVEVRQRRLLIDRAR